MRPLWERARRVHRPYLFTDTEQASRRLSKRRPASPGQVLALIRIADLVESRHIERWRHTLECPCTGTALTAGGPGRCACGLTSLFHALRNLRREAAR